MCCGFWHAGETKGGVPSGNAWGSGRRARSRPRRGSSAQPFFCLFWPPNPYSLGQSISLTHALIFFIYTFSVQKLYEWHDHVMHKNSSQAIYELIFHFFFSLPFFLFTPLKPYCTLCSPPVSEWLKCPSLQSEALQTLYCLVAIPGVFVQWCHPGMHLCIESTLPPLRHALTSLPLMHWVNRPPCARELFALM